MSESMVPVIRISKGKTYSNRLYYRLIMNDDRVCNVFQNNTDQFAVVETVYNDSKVDETEICTPSYPISISVVEKGKWLKISEVNVKREEMWT